MRVLKPCVGLLLVGIIVGALGYRFNHAGLASLSGNDVSSAAAKTSELSTIELSSASAAATERYRLDASQSKFIAHAERSGLLWFKGHGHLIGVRDFTGEAQLTPDSVTPASLQITAKTASMIETSSVFTEAQKKIIDKELREIVLLPDQYPDIVFRSTNVTGKAVGNGQYDLNIAGDLTLHGVTRAMTIPTKATVTGNDLRAQGEFSIDRSDFKVKATSAVHGLIRVANRVKFTFDIVGHRL